MTAFDPYREPHPQRSLQTRRAAGRDAGRFPTEPGRRVGKSAANPNAPTEDLSGKVLSLGYFSLDQQREVTRAPQAVGSSSTVRCEASQNHGHVTRVGHTRACPRPESMARLEAPVKHASQEPR